MITRVLVANRGEIASRVFRSCRALGMSTVAVYSDVDAESPYVGHADLAVRLPGTHPAQTYLRIDLLIDAARRTHADAIHPGYGFLSESAEFAAAVIAAGITWIGPSANAIEAMASKINAKQLMNDAGVPVLTQLDPASITDDDLPVLIKASAGGGGRGMRIVHRLADVDDALDAARAEALSAFGDGAVFCEPYVAAGHHIEVQILGDTAATVWTVGERECSIQRRHQKIIEEAPSPLVERIPGMRQQLFDAARLAAQAVSYVGAGTVEFLADDDGRFFFLEMNTRLQVEHAVTECTTGLDIVAWQLRIANGDLLPNSPPVIDGHSIEARLYAEDPAAEWDAQSGVMHRFAVPDVAETFGPLVRFGLRLDSGITDGSVISIYYDPMLAKVISWARTRGEAAARLASALARSTVHGVTTNRDLLVNVLRHPAFLAGTIDTSFFTTYGGAAAGDTGEGSAGRLATPLADANTTALSALAAALSLATKATSQSPAPQGLPSGWRNVVSQPHERVFRHRNVPRPTSQAGTNMADLTVKYRISRGELVSAQHPDVRLVEATATQVTLDVRGVRHRFDVAWYPEGEDQLVYVDSSSGSVALIEAQRFGDPTPPAVAGSLFASMPGSIIRLDVAVGDQVTGGQLLLTLEAMKMQHRVTAPTRGIVTELAVQVGDQVDVGAILVVVAPAGPNSNVDSTEGEVHEFH